MVFESLVFDFFLLGAEAGEEAGGGVADGAVGAVVVVDEEGEGVFLAGFGDEVSGPGADAFHGTGFGDDAAGGGGAAAEGA